MESSILQNNQFKKTNILFIDDRIPALDLGQGYPRSFKILEGLTALGYNVTLFPLQFPEKREPYASRLQQLGIELNYGNEKLNFQSFYRNKYREYDWVWVSRPHNMVEVIKVIKEVSPTQKLVYDAEAIYASRNILMEKILGKKFSEKEEIQLIMNEVKLMEQANLIIAVSENERNLIKKYCTKEVRVVGHTIDENFTNTTFQNRKDLLFIGTFMHPASPNEDAILHFVKKIFPIIRQKIDAKLWIVGTNQLSSIQNLASENIIVTGAQEDLKTYYENCRVFIVPTRYAAGIPLKLIECFSYGLPAIMTPLIAEQMNIVNNQMIGVSDGDFAQKVISCYNNENIWNTNRNIGRNFVERNCRWEYFLQSIVDLNL
jgi:glycosyltransferase involved in cell wall biosynthesis